MSYYEKSEIRAGIFMEKDASIEPATSSTPTLTDIAQKLERVKKKLAVLASVVGQRRLH